MADSSAQGIFSLNDVRIRQNKNVWPLVDFTTTVSAIGSQNYLFTIDTKGSYSNQFLYYALNSVDTGNSILASDFADNSIEANYILIMAELLFLQKKY